MDFEKIKPAVEEIQLSEIQHERIIEACEKQKKKSFNYKLWIPVAAAAVFTVVIFSPGFIFRASKSADNMAAPESGNGFDYMADSFGADLADEEIYVAVEDYITQVVVSAQSQSTAVEVKSLFNSGVYRKIYSVIPSQFAWLVDSAEYEKWEKSVRATDGMAMLQFVEHFGISHEEFDSANQAYASYINSTFGGVTDSKPSEKSEEELEIFNADIIYSFDKERINEYYLSSYN